MNYYRSPDELVHATHGDSNSLMVCERSVFMMWHPHQLVKVAPPVTCVGCVAGLVIERRLR